MKRQALRLYDSSERVVEFFCFCVIDGNDKTAATLEWNSNDDEATLFDSLHWPVSGPRLHGSHE
jgi:hypothetical protein